jgi:hypothetical protein
MVIAAVTPRELHPGTSAVLEGALLNDDGETREPLHVGPVVLERLEYLRLVARGEVGLGLHKQAACLLIDGTGAGVLMQSHAEKPLEAGRGFVSHAGPVIGDSLTVVGIGQIGLGGDGLIEEGNGFIMTALHLGDGRQTVERPCIAGLKGYRFAEELFGGVGILFVPEVEVPQYDPVGGIGGIKAKDFDEVIGRAFHVTGFHAAHRQITAGAVQRRLKLQRAVQQFDGAAEFAAGSALSGLLCQSGSFGLGSVGFLRKGNDDLIALDGDPKGLGKKSELLKHHWREHHRVGSPGGGGLPVKLVKVGNLEADTSHGGEIGSQELRDKEACQGKCVRATAPLAPAQAAKLRWQRPSGPALSAGT